MGEPVLVSMRRLDSLAKKSSTAFASNALKLSPNAIGEIVAAFFPRRALVANIGHETLALKNCRLACDPAQYGRSSLPESASDLELVVPAIEVASPEM